MAAAVPARRKWLLGGALLLTAAATAWVSRDDDGAVVTPASAQTQARPAPHARAAQAHGDGAVALPEIADAERYAETVQDVFAGREGPRRAAIALPPVVQAPPSAPPLPFTYLGRLEDGAAVTVFLADADHNYAARPGDVLDGRYRVEAIDGARVTLTYLPLNTQQTLTIGETP